MCGITGYVGQRIAMPVLLEGLKAQEYRGYDSAGIAVLENGVINLTRTKGKKDARQMIVSLTGKGKGLQKQLADVPFKVGGSVICESLNPETSPELFRMLDDIIAKLSAR